MRNCVRPQNKRDADKSIRIYEHVNIKLRTGLLLYIIIPGNTTNSPDIF